MNYKIAIFGLLISFSLSNESITESTFDNGNIESQIIRQVIDNYSQAIVKKEISQTKVIFIQNRY